VVTLTVVDSDEMSGSASVDLKVIGNPVIEDIAFDACVSERCNASIVVTAFDPLEGLLTYTYTPLNGGSIIGSGPAVLFDPPAASLFPRCEPYRIKVTVTSSETGLSAEDIIEIIVKLAGDVNGDGAVNVLDKVQVRNFFGQSGAPGFVDADVNCDGAVNILDKVAVRNQFGQRGCPCEQLR
jgi:hypothetical protein